MGPRAVRFWCGQSRHQGIRSPDRPARSESLSDYTIPAHDDDDDDDVDDDDDNNNNISIYYKVFNFYIPNHRKAVYRESTSTSRQGR